MKFYFISQATLPVTVARLVSAQGFLCVFQPSPGDAVLNFDRPSYYGRKMIYYCDCSYTYIIENYSLHRNLSVNRNISWLIADVAKNLTHM